MDGDEVSDAGEKVPEDSQQAYWGNAVSEYQEIKQVGPEISSPLASATKVMWEKHINPDKLKDKLQSSNTPSNCAFLQVKLVNPEIWANAKAHLRVSDLKLQGVQQNFGASMTHILRATDKLCEHAKLSNLDLKPTLEHLKQAISLAGAANQSLNQHRRENFKNGLPSQIQKLAKVKDDEGDLLFGQDIGKRVTDLETAAKVPKVFAKPDNTFANPSPRSDSHSNRYQGYNQARKEKNNPNSRRNTEKPYDKKFSGNGKTSPKPQKRSNYKGPSRNNSH